MKTVDHDKFVRVVVERDEARAERDELKAELESLKRERAGVAVPTAGRGIHLEPVAGETGAAVVEQRDSPVDIKRQRTRQRGASASD